jgi:hypothetical protein
MFWMTLTSNITDSSPSPTEWQVIRAVNKKIIERWPANAPFAKPQKVRQQMHSMTDHVTLWHGVFEGTLRDLLGEWSRTKPPNVSE